MSHLRIKGKKQGKNRESLNFPNIFIQGGKLCCPSFQ